MGGTVLGIRFLKTSPTHYTLLYKGGKVVREGMGLSFFYYAPTSSLVRVPVAAVDVPFAFEDVSADFQAVTLQGQLSYRVNDPKKLASLLDFSTDQYGRYASDDPQRLSDRLVAAVQVLCADLVHQLSLRELLTAQQRMSAHVSEGLLKNTMVGMLGVEILGVSIFNIKPNPETTKALEAEAREVLLRQADEAIYARRNAAVEQERRIKESELATELAVEEKRKQIGLKKMEAAIEAEQERQKLIATRVENERKQADAQAYALEASLKPLRQTDWRVVMAASAAKMDPRTGVALAFRELAENAAKIGQLNISPELLAGLLGPAEEKQ
jgi:regulator of protease activity HflC (stomatin/prohibitin superfamily)